VAGWIALGLEVLSFTPIGWIALLAAIVVSVMLYRRGQAMPPTAPAA
jgi:hypothetical protein